MRKLFDMDKKDYSQCTRTFTRHSARSIIVRKGKVAMVLELLIAEGMIEKGETT